MQINKTVFREIISEALFIIERDPSLEDVLQAIAQLLSDGVAYYNWVGFYLLDREKNELVLGPYVGSPTTHTNIPVGKGVCGQVAEHCKTLVVQDVSKMDNYLSCSIHVESEIVVPILKEGKFVAEIDIDSHSQAPFSEEDSIMLEEIARMLSIRF